MIQTRTYRYSRRAIADLVRIYTFISATDQVAADRLIQSVREKVAKIARSGFSGVNRDHIAPGLRAVIHKNHCIYFQIKTSHIHIVRILHGRQNLSAEDFPESET